MKTGTRKLVMKTNFKDVKMFSENLMGVEMGITKIKMTKPVYLGQAILDLSKIVMYEFHYDYMLPKYGGDRTTAVLYGYRQLRVPHQDGRLLQRHCW